MLNVARFGIAFCMLAAAASAQATRFAHAGRVLDEQRKPVAKAQVTLVGAGVCDGIDENDVVRVDGDAEGRFRAQLQPARAYTAWAAIPTDGGFLVSAAVDVGALPCELVVAVKVTDRLRVERTDAWRALGPLRVEVEPAVCRGLVLGGALGDDGTMQLPPLPPAYAALRVFAKDAVVHATSGKVHEPFVLLPPQRLRVRVVDEQDRPVAGATIARVLENRMSIEEPFLQRSTTNRHAVATTGDDGSAEVLLAGATDPLASSPGPLVLHASCDGRGNGIAGIASELYFDDKIAPEAWGNGVPPIRLHAPRTLRVRTHGAAPSLVQITGGRPIPYHKALMHVDDRARASLRDGVLAFEPPWGPDCLLEIRWPSLGLAADDPWQRSERPLPLVLPASVLEGNELDLREVLPLRLQVLDASAGPAIGACVLCAAATADGFVRPDRALRVFADRSGRAVLPVLPGQWFVMAVLDTSVAHTVIDVAPALAPQTLQLKPLDCMRVRVVDGDGKPVANATFRQDLHPHGGSAPTTALERQLYVAGSQAWGWMLRRCTTDAKGNADVPLLTAACPDMELRVHASGGGSAVVRTEASAQRREIVVK